jgi:hypothetical protein
MIAIETQNHGFCQTFVASMADSREWPTHQFGQNTNWHEFNARNDINWNGFNLVPSTLSKQRLRKESHMQFSGD